MFRRKGQSHGVYKRVGSPPAWSSKWYPPASQWVRAVAGLITVGGICHTASVTYYCCVLYMIFHLLLHSAAFCRSGYKPDLLELLVSAFTRTTHGYHPVGAHVGVRTGPRYGDLWSPETGFLCAGRPNTTNRTAPAPIACAPAPAARSPSRGPPHPRTPRRRATTLYTPVRFPGITMAFTPVREKSPK